MVRFDQEVMIEKLEENAFHMFFLLITIFVLFFFSFLFPNLLQTKITVSFNLCSYFFNINY